LLPRAALLPQSRISGLEIRFLGSKRGVGE
jgi:hypothetical protein